MPSEAWFGLKTQKQYKKNMYLLWVIHTVAFRGICLKKYLTANLASSDLLSGIPSDILSCILSDLQSGIFYGILCDIFSDKKPGILSDVSSGILSDILSEIYLAF